MASKGPGAKKKITKPDLISDGYLFHLLESMEALLNNKNVVKRSPRRAERLRALYDKMKPEAEKRMQILEETKKTFIVEWLNNIDISQIEPLKPEPLQLEPQKKF